MMIRISLSWPPSILKPNNVTKTHWGARMKAKEACKLEGYLAGIGVDNMYLTGVNVPIKMTFYPPRNQGDIDGYLGQSKYLLDGLAKGLNINDKQFRPMTLDVGKADKLNPRVEIEIG